MENNKIELKNLIMVILAVALAFLLKLKYIDGKESFSVFSPKENNLKAIANANKAIHETPTEEQPMPENENHNENNEEVFKVVEEAPRFPGCEDKVSNDEKKRCADLKMLEYLYKNIKYPLAAKERGIQGRVVVTFVVEKDGSISDVKVVRDIGAGCGEEAIRVVNSMDELAGKWIPGKMNGNAARVQFNLPVSFRLN